MLPEQEINVFVCFLKPRCGQGEANQVNKKHHEQSYERTSNHANHLDKESL